MNKGITPCLWFDTQADEAAKFYCAIFPNSKITETSYFGDAGPRPAGMVLTVVFELDGMPFTALNGGPEFKFSEAVSLQVFCDTQEEVDRYWSRLTADGGAESVCGWLKDKFGFSWQIVPNRLIELMQDEDKTKAKRATEALMKMKKIDIGALEAAARG